MSNPFDEEGWRIVGPIGGDASARTYTRVEKGVRTAVVMDARGCPSQEVEQFVMLADYLRDHHVRTPKILGREDSVLLLEDFGDRPLRDVSDSYGQALEIMEALSALEDLPPLPDFFSSPLYIGHRRVLDWYVPLARGRKLTPGLIDDYHHFWADMLEDMPPPQRGFVHGDFHLDNMMSLPDEGVGLIDFQGAVYGPLAYDAVNLFYDARTASPPDKDAFLAGRDEGYRRWYDFLALVFHSRVIGQFIKLAAGGKDYYLQHIPALERRMQAHLAKPEFTALSAFFQALEVDFSGVKDFNGERIKELVRKDAY